MRRERARGQGLRSKSLARGAEEGGRRHDDPGGSVLSPLVLVLEVHRNASRKIAVANCVFKFLVFFG